MTESRPTSPEDPGTPRRGIFTRRPEAPGAYDPQTGEPVRIVSLDQAVEIRVEEGLHRIEEQAAELMREIAAEMWRTSGSDTSREQDRILSFLSRDQTIRSLLASSDERFQTLAVRTARVEDSLSELAASTRQVRDAIQVSAEAIREIANSPTLHGVEAVRTELEQVEAHIAATFTTLQARDQLLTDSIQTRVQDHGELIARETGRIVEAMEGYVQAGAEAVGRLAMRMEEHAVTFASQDAQFAAHVQESMAAELRPVAEQMEILFERAGILARTLETVQTDVERMIDTRASALSGAIDERTLGIAQLVRSDSKALQTLIEERMAAQDGLLAETLDRHLETLVQVSGAQIQSLQRTADDQLSALTIATSATVERNLGDLADRLDSALEDRMATLVDRVAERIAEGVAEKVAARATETMHAAVSSGIEHTVEQIRATVEAIDGIDTMMAETQAVTEERLTAHIDDRMTGIARLIRSDNRVLAETLEEAGSAMVSASRGGAAQLSETDAEIMKQTLRAVKELEAGLASDMLGSMDRRFQSVADQLHKETQSTAESMIKVAEVLGEKIDRLSFRVDESGGDELRVAVERLSEAMRAISRPRIELD